VASRNRGDDQIVGQVGWLFADVLLGLAMFYFAIGTSVPVAALPPTATPSPTPLPTLRPNEPTRTPSPTPEPTWTPTPSPTVTVTPTATPAVCGVDRNPVTKTIDVPFDYVESGDFDRAALEISNQIAVEYGSQIQAGQRAGLVYVFTGLRSGNESIPNAHARAAKMEPVLKKLSGFQGVVVRGVHHVSIGRDKMELEVFFLVKCE
jgi:hypothetical protein